MINFVFFPSQERIQESLSPAKYKFLSDRSGVKEYPHMREANDEDELKYPHSRVNHCICITTPTGDAWGCCSTRERYCRSQMASKCGRSDNVALNTL